MKRLLVFSFFLLLFLFIPKHVIAAENWTIQTFDSTLILKTSGKVQVTEVIKVDFGSESKHGIFRKIPISYEGPRYVQIDYQKITQDGSDVPYTVSSAGGYAVAKIGNPNKTISGTHTYLITYEATGVLNSFSDHDELYWNVLGDQWPVTAEGVTVVVELPPKSFVASKCYEGPKGSTAECDGLAFPAIVFPGESPVNRDGFGSKNPIAPGSDMSVVVSIKKGTVPILTVKKPTSSGGIQFSIPAWSWGLFFLVLILGLGGVVTLWFRSGRDLWWQRKYLDDPNTKTSSKPIGSHDTIVVEFSPPEKLRPAEIGTLLDEKADTLDVTATIIDLANRGYLKITEIPKKWLFGKTDYQLEKTKNSDNNLRDYESYLLDHLVVGNVGQTSKLSDLKTSFYKELAEVKTKLYQNLTAKKYFASNPEVVRKKYVGFGVALVVLGGAGFFFGLGLGPLVFMPTASLFFIGAALAVFSYFMPRRTALGHEMYRRSRGFQLFISKAEKYRQQFFEKENLFNDFLAYAIVFGCTEKFAKAFADMGLKPPQPSWYVGNAPFNALYFGTAMASFSSSMSQAIASTPASSGSSGFGGGGFSGGGFGGGGGGSW